MKKTVNFYQQNKPLDEWPTMELVRCARDITGLNQTAFGAKIGKTQSVVSKYERGEAEPPRTVISHCMTIVRKWEMQGAPTASLEQVVSRLRDASSLPTAPGLYRAVLAVIDAISAGAKLPASDRPV